MNKLSTSSKNRGTYSCMKSDLDELNEFLLKVANADRVGVRVKIAAIKKYLREINQRALIRQQEEKNEEKENKKVGEKIK